MLITQDMLPNLDTLTKYPSIPTYHIIQGKDLTELRRSIDANNGGLILSEKFDGTGARIIFGPGDDIYIGSRGDILTRLGDFVPNKELGIVAALRPIAERLAREVYVGAPDGLITVVYGEVYGGKATDAWQQYGDGEARFRVFDMADFSVSHLEEPVEALAAWRENAGEHAWYPETILQGTTAMLGLGLTTRLGEVERDDLPQTIADTLEFGVFYRDTTDGPGLSEGLVISDRLRKHRLKIRWKDYEKVMRKRTQANAIAARIANQQAALLRKKITKEGSRTPNK